MRSRPVTYTWRRADEGYLLGAGDAPPIASVYDNGAGLGPAAGSGRWAVVDATGTWRANVDTLKAAKTLAEEIAL